MSSPKVLISGGGPSGLVAALALLQNGIPVRIIDKLSTYRVGFKGSGIQPRTLELYNLLGVLPDLLARSGRITTRKVHLPNGQTVDREVIALLDDTPDRPYNNPIMIGQDRHEALLREHLASKYGCQVELGVELVSFEQSADGVTAHLVHHNDNDTKETFEALYLVGCDGAHSVVRKQLNISFLGEGRLEASMVTGDIHVKSPLDPSFWHTWGDRSNKIASLRAFETRDGRFNFMLGGSDIDTHAAAESRESFIKAFSEVSGNAGVEFGDLIWISHYQPQVRMVDKFSFGRVFIVGDAAHVHSPLGGQGLNTSVQDAFNLAWKLALVLKRRSPPSILESYSSERLPVVATMLDLTLNLTKNVFGAKKDQEMSFYRDPVLRQLGVNYRGSSIVVDDMTVDGEVFDPYRSGVAGVVRGGDRAPDAPGLKTVDGKTLSLFGSLFGSSYHTLLVFGEPPKVSYPADLVKTVVVVPEGVDFPNNSQDGQIVLSDTQGYVHKHYDVDSRAVRYIVVRPDGAIGALATKEDSLKEYFDKIFSQT